MELKQHFGIKPLFVDFIYDWCYPPKERLVDGALLKVGFIFWHI